MGHAADGPLNDRGSATQGVPGVTPAHRCRDLRGVARTPHIARAIHGLRHINDAARARAHAPITG